ncbi:MAG: sn-glycerol-3-phosphate ABC transporter substrate-binding protein UgpB [Alphaproteobacteria bacterium]|nr:sn-glycerol-3-phosphate ABC transporter substrate-binding protein UgpB [Alphaproteobacteria bacterium]
MHRRSLLAVGAAAALSLAASTGARAQAPIDIQFWHAMTGPLGQIVGQAAEAFNQAQNRYRVVATFKGGYVDTMTQAIAAFRAGQAPHIVQMFEVGTATMMAAGRAIKPVHELFAEAGIPLNTEQYLAGVRGYYSSSDGKLISMPFNSSTAVLWYNKDVFRAAGLDPEKPPATWPEVFAAARQIRERNAAPCGFTVGWPTWTQFEQFSALHNIPFSTRANGFDGLDTELRINAAPFVRHLNNLVEASRNGSFKWGGRDNAAEPLYISGECAMIQTSSAFRARVQREAKFQWGATMLPFYPDVIAEPINSVIGGASLWVMTSPNRRAEEYRGVVEFFNFLSRPDRDAWWHQQTGYVPITRGGYEQSQRDGFYQREPGTDMPIHQLTRGTMTENSRGFRLGRFVEIRNIIQEEMEKALQGQQSAQAALDAAVQRGNRVLRDFERASR